MRRVEVEGIEGVGRGVTGLARLWKCVENGGLGRPESGMRLSG